MKKIIFCICSTIIFFGCKKTTTKDFEATDVTGITIVRGNISKNVIIQNRSGGWTNSGVVPVSGVLVQVKVNNSALYPNSSAQGASVYPGVTDNNGNYSIDVRTNSGGVPAQITVNGFTSTLDTLINGVTKKGFNASFQGTSSTSTLYMGQNQQLDFTCIGTSVQSNPNSAYNIGTGNISGLVTVTFIKEVLAGTLTVLTNTTFALANRPVFLNFNNDPNTLTTKYYQTTTDANGRYNFTVTTVAPSTPGFSQNATIWVGDYAASKDTFKLVAPSIPKPGRSGVYTGVSVNQTGIYNYTIRNGINLNYNNFIPN